MSEVAGTRVGIVGTGWMAATHTEALRRLGVDVAGLAGRTPAQAQEVADRLGLATAYDSVEALVKDDSLAAVHRDQPNDVHAEGRGRPAGQAARRLREALGVSAGDRRPRGVGRGQRTGQRRLLQPRLLPTTTTPPAWSRRRPRRAALRDRRLPPGLAAEETDWNWRLVAERQGQLRAVADIGSTGWTWSASSAAGRWSRSWPTCTPSCPSTSHPLGGSRSSPATPCPATPSGCASAWPATPGCCCGSRAACAGCARSARCRPAARTA